MTNQPERRPRSTGVSPVSRMGVPPMPVDAGMRGREDAENVARASRPRRAGHEVGMFHLPSPDAGGTPAGREGETPSPREFPPDLLAIERSLLGGPLPGSALRERVLGEVGRELRAAERGQFWQYVATVAAVFLIALNLSFSAAAHTPRPRIEPERHTWSALREEVERLDLGIPTDDIVRLCLLRATTTELLPMGRPLGSMPHGSQ